MFTEASYPNDPSRDELTNLPDRRSLNIVLESSLENHSGEFGVIIIDLDGLKQVNDALGHAAGDELIKKAADILQTSLRNECDDRTGDTVAKGPADTHESFDTAARYAGDEFVIVVTNTSTFDEVESIKDRLQKTLITNGVEASLGASHHTNGLPVSKLLAQADARMYRDKELRKVERYTAEQLEIARLIGKLSVENDIALSDLPALQKFLGESSK